MASNLPVPLVVFCSGSASSFRFLHQNDPNHGVLYRFVGVFSDSYGSSGIEYAKSVGINRVVYDYASWCKTNNVRRSDLAAREAYFKVVLDVIALWEPEGVLLSGFMLLITDPLLSQFEGRLLNVHPALLSIRDETGQRKYRGLNTVSRAMQAGDPTGSTVHIVTKETDMGPIVAESSAINYAPGTDPRAHQERMKTECDGPAFRIALRRLIADGWPKTPWRPR